MRVLLAVDDSKCSEAAAEALMQKFRPENMEVWVFHAVESDSIQVLKQGDALVHRFTNLLSKAGYKAQALLREGDPKSLIVDFATLWEAEMIVLGTHGRKGVDRLLLGSVAEGVVRNAPCSVFVVREAPVAGKAKGKAQSKAKSAASRKAV